MAHPRSAAHGNRLLNGLLCLVLLLTALTPAEAALLGEAQEPPGEAPDYDEVRESDPAAEEEAPQQPAEEPKDQAEGVAGDDEASVADDDPEVESDAMRDPVITKVIKARVVVDKPSFSMETGGKIQVQYFDGDPDDPETEDGWLLRRFRPFLMGRLGTDWRWKTELELSSELTALDFDTNDLDVRDSYVRYVGFERAGRRLTLGNQKPPFSRDFLTPSTAYPLTERTFVGSTKAGVPDRMVGIHFRNPTPSGKWVLWGSAGTASHKQDVQGIRFESTIGASSDVNLGWLAVARVDLRPKGGLFVGKEVHYDLSLAGYQWVNDSNRNPYTEGGEALDPERADLDRASGLEVSGRVRTTEFFLALQYNLIRAETVVPDFTGGVYSDGVTDLEAATVLTGVWMPGDWLELVGGLSRLDSDGYVEPWNETILGLTLDSAVLGRALGKVLVTHRWISSRFGLPDADFQETRFQIQYVW